MTNKKQRALGAKSDSGMRHSGANPRRVKIFM
jgi:hypothetical protein